MLGEASRLCIGHQLKEPVLVTRRPAGRAAVRKGYTSGGSTAESREQPGGAETRFSELARSGISLIASPTTIER